VSKSSGTGQGYFSPGYGFQGDNPPHSYDPSTAQLIKDIQSGKAKRLKPEPGLGQDLLNDLAKFSIKPPSMGGDLCNFTIYPNGSVFGLQIPSAPITIRNPTCPIASLPPTPQVPPPSPLPSNLPAIPPPIVCSDGSILVCWNTAPWGRMTASQLNSTPSAIASIQQFVDQENQQAPEDDFQVVTGTNQIIANGIHVAKIHPSQPGVVVDYSSVVYLVYDWVNYSRWGLTGQNGESGIYIVPNDGVVTSAKLVIGSYYFYPPSSPITSPLPPPPTPPMPDCNCCDLLKAIYAQVQTLPSPIPMGWNIRPEYSRPQAIFQFAQVDNNGNITGSPKYVINVPHLKNNQSITALPNYTKGNWEIIYVLNDNSKITVNALDQANAMNVLNAIIPLLDSNFTSNAYLSKNSLVVTKKPINNTLVKCRMCKFYSQGAFNDVPDWIIKF